MRYFKRGKLLNTSSTKRLSQSEKEKMDSHESKIIFSDFYEENQGKSRKRICELNETHPDFEQNRILIESAPEMLFILTKISEGRVYTEIELIHFLKRFDSSFLP